MNLFLFSLIITFLYSPILHAENIIIGGSGSDLATFKLLTDKFQQTHPETTFKILPSIGSGGGIKAIKSGRIDLCLISRTPKEKEKSDDIIFTNYAQTPFLFTVNKGLKLNNLSTQNILDIYSGKMTHWNAETQVKLILRPSNDSDTLILSDKVTGFKNIMNQAYKRRGLPIASTDQETIDLIGRLKGGIGTTSLSLIKTEAHNIKPVKLDGIDPSPANIANGKYKLFKDLHMCHNNKNITTELMRFINFVHSKDGREILNKTGHNIVNF